MQKIYFMASTAARISAAPLPGGIPSTAIFPARQYLTASICILCVKLYLHKTKSGPAGGRGQAGR